MAQFDNNQFPAGKPEHENRKAPQESFFSPLPPLNAPNADGAPKRAQEQPAPVGDPNRRPGGARAPVIIALTAAIVLCLAVAGTLIFRYGTRPAQTLEMETVTQTPTQPPVRASKAVVANATTRPVIPTEAPKKENRMRADHENIAEGYPGVFGQSIMRSEITAIVFRDTTGGAPRDAWDISEKGDGCVLAWVTGTQDDYTLNIAGDGGVTAPQDCGLLFCKYWKLERIDFNGAFDTSQTTSMSGMFGECMALTSLDLSDFDTAQVTDMSNMFWRCFNLQSLDLSGFDTSRVTDMTGMFFYCGEMPGLELGRFNTASVTEYYDFMDYDVSYRGEPWENLFR